MMKWGGVEFTHSFGDDGLYFLCSFDFFTLLIALEKLS